MRDRKRKRQREREKVRGRKRKRAREVSSKRYSNYLSVSTSSVQFQFTECIPISFFSSYYLFLWNIIQK